MAKWVEGHMTGVTKATRVALCHAWYGPFDRSVCTGENQLTCAQTKREPVNGVASLDAARQYRFNTE